MTHVAIVHPLTLLGKELRQAIGERHPEWEVSLLSAREEEVGTVTEVGGAAALVGAWDEEALVRQEWCFFCGEASWDRPLLARLGASARAVVLSTGASVEDGVPAVAGLPLPPLERGTIWLSPHPAVVGLAHLAQALGALGLERLVATAVVPASERGQAGLDELFEQTTDLLAFRGKPPKAVFGGQLAFNLLPAPGLGQAVESQFAALPLPPSAACSVQAVQGGVFHGLALSVEARMRQEVEARQVAAALRRDPSFELVRDGRLLGPIASAGSDRLLVGEIRCAGPTVWLWTVYDNLTVGAVANALSLAE